MQLTKFSYYSDFVIYPAVVVALTAANFMHFFSWQAGLEWLGEPLVRIERDRVGALNSAQDRLAFLCQRQRPTVGGIDVQP